MIESTPVPNSSLSPLLAAAELQDHLMIASNDLDRLQTLLTHACDNLLERFCGVSQQIEAVVQARTAGRMDDVDLQVLTQQLGGAVTALQFQDMASQLIDHTHRRLRNCADQLARETFGDDDEDGGTVVQSAPLRPNPVTQAEMDAGSIELF